MPTFVARLERATHVPPPIPVLDLADRSFEEQLAEVLAAMAGIEG